MDDNKIQKFIPGAIGAVFNSVVGHPFDTVRVRLQDINSKHSNTFLCMKHIYKTYGIRGFFKGFVPSTLGLMSETSTVFATNIIIREYLKEEHNIEKTNVLQDLLIGGVSGLASSIVSCPFETIKCNLQVNPKYKISIGNIGNLYSGFYAVCLRNIPLYTAFIPIYNYSIEKTSTLYGIEKESLKLYHHGICGGITGVLSWLIIYPFDVIKCNQQISIQKQSMIKTAKNLIIKDGITGLFKGIMPTLARAFPANFALLMGVEIGNRIILPSK
jgi:hypothetical protein